jgi:peptide/nickel transport system permease protein
MNWSEYTIQRLLMFVPILFGVSIFVFLIIHFVPGSPAVAMLGVKATPERVAQIEQELGLHRPMVVQYLDWVTNVLVGDFGKSYSYNKPVSSLLASRFFVSLEIILLTLGASALVAIPLGIVAALNKNTWIDYLSMGIGITGVSIPTFFSAVIFMAVFAVWADLLPVSGYVSPREDLVANLRYMVLPVLTMTLVAVAVIMRMMRSSMLETIGEDFIRFHKAKGLSRRSILLGHALKNSFIPVITVIGLQFGYMLSGAVVIEQIFAIPGLGRTVLQAVLQRDYPLVQGSVLMLALWFASVNLLTDLAITFLDPRIMEGGE